jgi:hypothetical protein
LVGDPGVLDGIGRVGVAEMSLNRRDIASFLYEVKKNSPLGKIAFIISFDTPSDSSFKSNLSTFSATCGEYNI